MTDYSNILNAIKSPPPTGETKKLTTAQELDNYAAFSDLQKSGVYLPDLVKMAGRVEELERRIDELGANPAEDEELFEAMEAAVKGEQEVKDAYQAVCDAKTEALRKICMNDPAFRAAFDDYRKAVHRAYIARGER